MKGGIFMKKGDFTGVYSKENGKPYFFVGYDNSMKYGNKKMLIFATDLKNKNTYARFKPQN